MIPNLKNLLRLGISEVLKEEESVDKVMDYGEGVFEDEQQVAQAIAIYNGNESEDVIQEVQTFLDDFGKQYDDLSRDEKIYAFMEYHAHGENGYDVLKDVMGDMEPYYQVSQQFKPDEAFDEEGDAESIEQQAVDSGPTIRTTREDLVREDYGENFNDPDEIRKRNTVRKFILKQHGIGKDEFEINQNGHLILDDPDTGETFNITKMSIEDLKEFLGYYDMEEQKQINELSPELRNRAFAKGAEQGRDLEPNNLVQAKKKDKQADQISQQVDRKLNDKWKVYAKNICDQLGFKLKEVNAYRFVIMNHMPEIDEVFIDYKFFAYNPKDNQYKEYKAYKTYMLRVAKDQVQTDIPTKNNPGIVNIINRMVQLTRSSGELSTSQETKKKPVAKKPDAYGQGDPFLENINEMDAETLASQSNPTQGGDDIKQKKIKEIEYVKTLPIGPEAKLYLAHFVDKILDDTRLDTEAKKVQMVLFFMKQIGVGPDAFTSFISKLRSEGGESAEHEAEEGVEEGCGSSKKKDWKSMA